MARIISSDADEPISIRVSPTDMVIVSCEVDLLKLYKSRESGNCCGVSTEVTLKACRDEATGTMSGMIESI